MGKYDKIILDLENDLSGMKDASEKITVQMEYAIGHCKVALDRMRELVIREGFPDKESEIYFFKEVKPLVYSRLLYYKAIFEIETNRQETDRSGLKKYYQLELKKIMKYMKKNQVRVQYYRCNYTYLDEQYFTRNNKKVPVEIKDSHSLVHGDFFTSRDHTFSMIRASEMLITYISKELENLESTDQQTITELTESPQWTGKKIDSAELIYALYYARVINGGKITIKELTEIFGKMFDMDLVKDIYRLHTEIQQRKIDRTKFLDYLRSVLQQRLDEEDE